MSSSTSSPPRSALFDQTNGVVRPDDDPALRAVAPMHRITAAAVAGFGGLGR